MNTKTNQNSDLKKIIKWLGLLCLWNDWKKKIFYWNLFQEENYFGKFQQNKKKNFDNVLPQR